MRCQNEASHLDGLTPLCAWAYVSGLVPEWSEPSSALPPLVQWCCRELRVCVCLTQRRTVGGEGARRAEYVELLSGTTNVKCNVKRFGTALVEAVVGL